MLIAHVLGVLTDFALKAYQIKLKLTQFNNVRLAMMMSFFHKWTLTTDK